MNPACPYCRADFELQDEITTCSACATPHHADCYAQNGGCTVFGCVSAPPDEPRIRVLLQDLEGQGLAAQGLAGRDLTGQDREGVLMASRNPDGQNANGWHRDGLSHSSAAGRAIGTRTVPVTSRPERRTQPASSAPGYYTPAGLRSAGFPLSMTYAIASDPSWYGYGTHKSRFVYVLLAVLLGAFGGHNFYAGYAKKGTMQLCITLCTFFYGGVISWAWALVDAFTVIEDDDGVLFE